MRKPTLKMWRGHFGAKRGETIAEFSNSKGVGGLMALRETETGGLLVELYRCDAGVQIRTPARPAVRFIIDTYCSLPDRSGNVSRWARIVSTMSGRSLNVRDVGGSQNIPHAVYKVLDSERPANFDVWSWMHYGEHDIPRKLFSPPEDAIYEGALTADLVRGLELGA